MAETDADRAGDDAPAHMTAATARRMGHAARAGLSADERGDRTRAAVDSLLALPELGGPGALATYLATSSEIDPAGGVDELRSRGWLLHLPRIGDLREDNPAMAFVPWRPDTMMRANRFGIREPLGDPVATTGLDVVIVPCVAADESGTRVGFGAGYYDRALRRDGGADRRRPLLVGLAFEAQCLEAIEAREWDVPLDVLVTEAAVRRFGSRARRGRGPGPGGGDDARAR